MARRRRSNIFKRATGKLYSAARQMNDITTYMSFSPSRIRKRIFNKFIGRKITKKFWLGGGN